MTHLRKLMLEELQRRNYSQTTVTSYIKTVANRELQELLLFARKFAAHDA